MAHTFLFLLELFWVNRRLLQLIYWYALPPLFRSFEGLPDVEFEILTEATLQLEKFFHDGRLDIAIVNKKLGAGIVHEKVLEDEILAVVPADHALAKRDWLEPEDFATEHLVTYTHPFPLSEHSWVEQFLNPAGVQLNK